MSNPKATVGDYMAKSRFTITPETLVTEAVKILLDVHTIGGPVVDKDNKVVGFISEQDCLRYLVSDNHTANDQATVKDLMRQDVLFVEPHMPIIDLAHLMCGDKPKKYPVCENGKLVGFISREHVMMALLK